MADVIMKFDAETAKLVQGFLKIEDKQNALIRKNEQIARATGRHASDAERGHSRWAQSVGGLVAQYTSLYAILGQVRRALSDMHQERQRAAWGKMAEAEAYGPLAQLAKTPEEMAALRAAADLSRVEVGMPKMMAGNLQFYLASTGKAARRATYAQLYGLADPEAMANAVATLQGGMTTREVGLDKQVLDKLFAASQVSKAKVGELAMAAAGAGKTAAIIGTTDEELIAALAVLSRGDVSADIISTQLEAFARQGMARGFRGRGLMEFATAIERRRMSPKALKTYLGRARAIKGYLGLIQRRPEIEALRAELEAVDITAAAAPGVIGPETAARVASYEAEYGPQREAARMRALEEIGREEIYGGAQTQRNILRARMRAIHMESPWRQWALTRMFDVMDWLGAPPEAMGWTLRRRGALQEMLRGRATTGALPYTGGSPPDLEVTVKDKRSQAGRLNTGTE